MKDHGPRKKDEVQRVRMTDNDKIKPDNKLQNSKAPNIKLQNNKTPNNKLQNDMKPNNTAANGLPPENGTAAANKAGQPKKRKKRLTNRQFLTRALIIGISILLLITIGVFSLWKYLFSGFGSDKDSKLYPTDALTNQPPSSKEITNILLLGVDARDPDSELGLSDSIIILTIDRKNNVIKMTSIMRDSFVYIPGRKNPEKINAAHNFGGPELALRTVNNTLRLNIEKYIVVNMFSMADIIDIAGGVTLTITKKERSTLNYMLTQTFPELGSDIRVEGYGEQKMNGTQAVMFARIRKIDGDEERSRRQRDVLKALFTGFKEINPIKKAQMIKQGLSSIKTNMTAKEITSLGIDVLPKMSGTIQELRLPIEGYYKVYSRAVWYMLVDYNRMIPEVYKFIYGKTQAFDPVPTIPKESGYNTDNNQHATATKSPETTETPAATEEPGITPTISQEVPTEDPFITATPEIVSEEPSVTMPEVSPTITAAGTISPTLPVSSAASSAAQ